MMLIVAALLALVIGLVLGMLGGGGAILTLPMLVYVLHVEAKPAIATSLFVVGATSVMGTVLHARAGNVRWKIGLVFGASAMAGAFAGGRTAHLLPGKVLLVVFAVLMVVTAIAMLRGRKEESAASEPAIGRVLVLGAGVGLLSGLVGAGGGFLIVPALTLFGGVALREAIGTSLFVITLQSFAGFAGHIGHVQLDWPLVLLVAGAAVTGAIAGASLGKKVPVSALRRGFAWLVLAMGLFMFSKELPLIAALPLGAASLLALYLVTRKNNNACTTSLPSPPSSAER